MTAPVNMLFDATALMPALIPGARRAGIFFCAYNLLNEFSKDERFNITLYIQENERDIYSLKNDPLCSRFPLCVSLKDNWLRNIAAHKRAARAEHNRFRRFISVLKILKNRLRIIFRSRDNTKILLAAQIYFSGGNAPTAEIIRHDHIKHFLVLHDAILLRFPEYFPDADEDYWFYILARYLNKNTYCFCNSEATKKDFLSFFPDRIDKKKLYVIPHAAGSRFTPQKDKSRLVTVLNKYGADLPKDASYIFSLCTLEPRKNLIFTVRCFFKFIKKHAVDNLYFILGGGHWEHFIEKLKECTENFDLSRIARLGYVDDEDVNILYSNALFFTYISQYEGFGVPPLEAMASGTPVITSNNSSMPEVVGDAAVTIDWDNEAQCVKAMEDFYFNEKLRTEYAAKGLARAGLFSWEKTARAMAEVMTGA